jgi:cation:H+ antiporter
MAPGWLLLGGLIALVAGGELLVRGASRLAGALGLSPLVIGLTVVAFGTSAPELAVSLAAGLGGNPAIALANVVGSNIFNILLILGVCAVAVPLVVAQQVVRLEVPILIVASLALLGLAADRRIVPLEGALLFGGLVVYTVWAIRRSRRESAAVRAEYEAEFGRGRARLLLPAVLVVAGLALLVAGAQGFVAGAVALARAWGVDEVVIGLTIVAAGTSLPEVVTSLVASLKGERDIAIGNVIGSSLFNILSIAGLAAIVTPGGLTVAPSLLALDLPVMVACAVACLPIFAHGYRIARAEGAFFLALYVAYAAYLVLDSTQHAALPAYSGVMVAFVLPLVFVTLLVLGVRALRGARLRRPTG